VLPAEYITDQRDILGQAIQADLKKIGVQVNRPAAGHRHYLTEIYGGKTELRRLQLGAVRAGRALAASSTARAPRPPAGRTPRSSPTPELTQWTNQGRATLDAATRKTVYAKVQKRVIEAGLLMVPVYVPQTIIGVASRTTRPRPSTRTPGRCSTTSG
jgi:peptide/nickel transport system substrate-binding protein